MSSGSSGKQKKRRPVRAKPPEALQDELVRGVDTGVTVTTAAMLDERGVDPRNSRAWRRALGNEYVFNPRGISLADLANRPELGNVSLAMVTHWSRTDRWVEKRKKFGELIQRRVEAELANEIGRSRLREMRKLIRLQKKLEAKVNHALENSELKSLEQGLSVLLRIGERIDVRREQIQNIFPVNRGPGQSADSTDEQKALEDAGPLVPRLTDNEAAIAARAVLLQRQEQWAEPKAVETQDEPAPVAPRKKRPPKAVVGPGKKNEPS